ncbi:unnamed protein product [Linum trigynum]|uniref:Reverse transcriptase zinc-binding domain-containing protein n=1 Tax=Linum trigynum TaxID=586398 RepID=A0AAV2E3U3_9ROSI
MTSFSIKRVCQLLRPAQQTVGWWKLVWKGKAIPRNRVITWLVIRGSINTKVKMQRWGYGGSLACCLCGVGVEDRDHIYGHCPFVRQLLESLFYRFMQIPTLERREDVLTLMVSKLGGAAETVETGRIIWQS